MAKHEASERKRTDHDGRRLRNLSDIVVLLHNALDTRLEYPESLDIGMEGRCRGENGFAMSESLIQCTSVNARPGI